MARILVVEDSPVQARHLEFILKSAGHDPECVGHGVAALEAIRRQPPDLVLTDMHMPLMNGLDLVHALRGECPALPVVMTTDRGSEELAVQALRGGASGYIPKRNLARDVVSLVDEILGVTANQKTQAAFLDRLTAAEYQFTLENDTELIGQVVGQVEAVMKQMSLFDEAGRMRVGVAVHEAVVNGMVHGNLGVSSELKDGDWDAYLAAVAARRATPPYSDRRVRVTVKATRAALEVRVKDEGAGYNPAALPDPTDPVNIEKGCGRGLLLIRTFFDEVTHEAGGTEIVMVKK